VSGRTACKIAAATVIAAPAAGEVTSIELVLAEELADMVVSVCRCAGGVALRASPASNDAMLPLNTSDNQKTQKTAARSMTTR
jgi:hypothetical protein